jgi:hypothetical protein
MTTRTVVGYRGPERALTLIGLPLATTLIGLGVPPLARWLQDLPGGLPFGVVFAVLGSADRPWEVLVNAGIWLAVGLSLAWTAATDEARLIVTDQHLQIRGGGVDLTVDRAGTHAVFLDRADLVVLDRRSCPLARVRPQGSPEAVEQALRAHGYPWRAEDPYAGRFRRWPPTGRPQPDVPPVDVPPVDVPPADVPPVDLPAAAGPLLRLRQARLDRHDEGQARELRDALHDVGVVVRDEGGHQYWRLLADGLDGLDGASRGSPP